MRFELFNGPTSVGSVTWEGPGQIRLDVGGEADRRFLAEYFAGETVYLSAGVDDDGDGLAVRRRDWTPWEFERACHSLDQARSLRAVARPVGPVEDPDQDRRRAAS